MAATTDLRFDTGRVSLDLLATVGSRLSDHPIERLDGLPRLETWLRRTGLVPDDERVELDGADLAAFTSLRDLLHRIIHTELGGRPAARPDLERLNRIAAAGTPALQLVRDRQGVLRRRLAPPVDAERLLAAVAADAIDLLTSPERAAMRECEGPTCDLVYIDHSRGRRRRWCSAATCANRHYVAAHRSRRAHPA